MTREEAKPYIGELKMYAKSRGWDEEYLIACDVAMNDLEQEPVLDKIRAEIESIIGEHNWDDYDFCSGLICARKIIDKYKADKEQE